MGPRMWHVHVREEDAGLSRRGTDIFIYDLDERQESLCIEGSRSRQVM